MAGAGVGAGLGAIGGPGTAVVGGMLGEAAGEMVKNSGDPTGAPVVDVQALLASKMGEERGFFQGAIDELYGLLKLVGICFAIIWLVPLLYTQYRKRKAQGYYATIEDLAERLNSVEKFHPGLGKKPCRHSKTR